MQGKVFIVGAGIGGVEFLTVRARDLLCQAEVIISDALVDRSSLDLAPPKCDRITYEIIVRFVDCLNEEKPLPYFFDVVYYEAIAKPMLKADIDRVGVNLKERNRS